MSAYKSNLYIDPAINIIGPSTHVLDVGVFMFTNCMFDFYISNLYKRCSNLGGWILRTFTMRDFQVMLILYKQHSLNISSLDSGFKMAAVSGRHCNYPICRHIMTHIKQTQ